MPLPVGLLLYRQRSNRGEHCDRPNSGQRWETAEDVSQRRQWLDTRIGCDRSRGSLKERQELHGGKRY